MLRLIRAPLISLLCTAAIGGCTTLGSVSDAAIRRKLAVVGLQLITEEEAAIPRSERGKFIPCRVRANFPNPALPPHDAGYLIVGLAGKQSTDKAALLAAMAGWKPGETLRVRVRRNPYLDDEAEWWESEGIFIHP